MEFIKDDSLRREFESEVEVHSDLVPIPGRKYLVQGSYTLTLPDTLTEYIEQPIIVCQISGNGTVAQNNSEYGIDGSERRPSTVSLDPDDIKYFYLIEVYGRRVWYEVENDISAMINSDMILSRNESTPILNATIAGDFNDFILASGWEVAYDGDGNKIGRNYYDLGKITNFTRRKVVHPTTGKLDRWDYRFKHEGVDQYYYDQIIRNPEGRRIRTVKVRS